MSTTVTIKGQVTLPKNVRDAAGIKPGDRVEVRATTSGGVYIEKAGRKNNYKERLFAIGQLGLIKGGKSTDEIMRELRGDSDEDPGFNPNIRPGHGARRK